MQLSPCDAAAPADDGDNDGIVDSLDHCPIVADAAQHDTDGDGTGDACDDDDDSDGIVDDDDLCPLVASAECNDDSDGDGRNDNEDLCPLAATAADEDRDGDGLGDNCDSDDDEDGVSDLRDGCANDNDPEQRDEDNDGYGDVCDRCPGFDDNKRDTACGPVNGRIAAPLGCAAVPAPLWLMGLGLLGRRRMRTVMA